MTNFSSQLTKERFARNKPPELPWESSVPHYSKTDLKSLGWTDKLILDFLGKADFNLRNPRNFRYSICCYDKTRVDSLLTLF